MLATHPYTSWPLQVTLFTPTAVKMWKDVCKEADKDLPLPAGFRETVALEGVDGRAGASCEDWRRPLDVTDGAIAVIDYNDCNKYR
jgi:structure-specific endonuclease subunit SLX1